MNQENFGKFIKEIRKKNNLTQKEFAEKYNVTYQAVSKWENGKNMPDMTLIKQMSNDFNISLEEMLEGKLKPKKNKYKKIIIGCVFVILILIIIFLIFLMQKEDSNFNFKTLSSACGDFNLSGNIAYNEKKSSIYITDIEYCGKQEKEKYTDIECTLYEESHDTQKKISSCNYSENGQVTLKDFLQTVTLTADDYKKICREYSNNSLFLEIKAQDSQGKTTAYKVPLSLKNNCPAKLN